MAARLKFYIDWLNKKLVKSDSNGGLFIPPVFYQGDVIPMQVYIVEPDPDGTDNDFVSPAIDNMALSMAVSDTPTGSSGGPTPFVTQYTWSKDTNEKYFYAEVAFNTAELNTFIGSARTTTGYMEFQITEGTAITTAWQGTITIDAEVIEASSASVAPGETALSLEAASQIFVKRQLENGGQIRIPSPDGTKLTVLWTDNDGTFHMDVL